MFPTVAKEKKHQFKKRLAKVKAVFPNGDESYFSDYQFYGVGVDPNPIYFLTADLNRDSTPEIIVSNWEVEGMRVIHNFLPVSDNILGDINGYLYQHDVSDCQDPCSQYYIEPD